MITPDRALRAFATSEDVFTPDGTAGTISAITADFIGVDAVFIAHVVTSDYGLRRFELADLTTREDVRNGGAA